MDVLRSSVTVCLLVLCELAAPAVRAQDATASDPKEAVPSPCFRAAEGSTVPEPQDLRSENGVLRVDLTFHDYKDSNGTIRYCYATENGDVGPNLRLHPGDTLILRLKNQATVPDPKTDSASEHAQHVTTNMGVKHDPCAGGTMTLTSTNLHFHGLVIPAACHQDETLKTLIQPTDDAFEYRFQIPARQQPGLYWY